MSLDRQNERRAVAKATRLNMCMCLLATALRKYIRRLGWSASYDLKSNLKFLMNQCRQGKRSARELPHIRLSLLGRHAMVTQNFKKILTHSLVFSNSWINVAESIGDYDAAKEMVNILSSYWEKLNLIYWLKHSPRSKLVLLIVDQKISKWLLLKI